MSINGLQNLELVLQGMQRGLSGVSLQQCTAAAAQPMLQEAKTRAPVLTGAVREALQVVTAPGRRGSQASSTVEVAHSGPGGPTREAIFAEYGTSKQAARPFMRPAFDFTQQQAVAAFAEQLAHNLSQTK